MVTKKEHNTAPFWALECFKQLKQAHQSTEFKGKSEKKLMKDFINDGVFMWIIIDYGGLRLLFPLDEVEYDVYKKLEIELWRKKDVN